MRRQRNMFQTKEQDRTSKEELSKVEISNLPDKEFKTMITRCSTNSGEEWMNTVRNLIKSSKL